MVDRDTVLAKVATIDRCLARIAEVRARRSSLSQLDFDDIVVLNLQRAAQATIDLATHVVATEAWGLPDSVAGSFAILEREGVVDGPLAERMRRMTGFRNIAVHDYTTLDPAIIERIVDVHLGDFRDFAAAVVRRFP